MKGTSEHKKLQWHPAFSAFLQIELEQDADILQFTPEHNLTEKPQLIDILITKQKPGKMIKKSIGRIFRRFNVVEYKSPDDYVSINDFYHVMAYTCLYQSLTSTVNTIRPEELTISFACYHYPKKLISSLKKDYHITIELVSPGIYYIKELMFPIQIILLHQLPAEEYIWLSRMRGNLNLEDDIEPLAKAYKGKEKHPSYEAAMDLIIRANKKLYEEDKNMCDALRELFADELVERENRGIEKGISQGISQGIEKGIAESILELLSELGEIPETVTSAINAQSDPGLLKTWLKLAAKANSIDQFAEQLNILQ